MPLLMQSSALAIRPPTVDVLIDVFGPLGTYTPTAVRIVPECVHVGVVVPGTKMNPYDPDLTNPPDPVIIYPPKPDPGPLMLVAIGGSVPADQSGKTYQRQKSDTGSGAVTVQGTAGASYGSLMSFSLGGSLKQTAIVEQITRKIIAGGEEAEETTTYAGRGLIAEWERMVVYPDIGAEIPSRLGPPTQEDRFFNWTASSALNDDSWPQAVPTNPYYGHDSHDTPPARFTRPEGWPWAQGQWIWDREAVGSVPDGDVYFRLTFGVPFAGRYQVWAACDDEYELWLDGVKVLERAGVYTGQAEHTELEFGNHFHQFAVRATNRVGRAGLQVALMPVNSNGTLGHAAVQSDAAWQVLAYPAKPPGATVGKVLRILLDEANARGTLTGWSLGFSDKVDSNGRTWPFLPDYSLPCGMDGLSVLGQLAGSLIDFTFPPGQRRLLAYNIDGMGSPRTGPSPLTELTIAGEG